MSVSVKILKLSGTANLQLGSLYAGGVIAISRVSKRNKLANNKKDLCIRNKPPSENTKFGIAFLARARVELLAGNFKAAVHLFGVKLPAPTLHWKGLKWKLPAFCAEPEIKLGKLPFLPMEPSMCPAMKPSGFTRSPLSFAVTKRG